MAQCDYQGELYDCTLTDKYILPLFNDLDSSALATWVKESTAIVPWAGCFHLLALALLGGAVIMADLRNIGPGLTTPTPKALNTKMRPYMIVAVIVLVISGFSLALGELMKLFYSPPYWVKMASLFSALVFTFGVRDSLVQRDGRFTPVSIVLGVLSLGGWLWVFAGLSSSLARVAFLIMIGGLALLVVVYPTGLCDHDSALADDGCLRSLDRLLVIYRWPP